MAGFQDIVNSVTGGARDLAGAYTDVRNMLYPPAPAQQPASYVQPAQNPGIFGDAGKTFFGSTAGMALMVAGGYLFVTKVLK